MSENRSPSVLEMLLRSRRGVLMYLGALLLPLEFVGAVSRGNAVLAAIFGCLTVVMWIELAASRGANVEALRWIEWPAVVAFVVLYLYYVVFRWRDFLRDGF